MVSAQNRIPLPYRIQSTVHAHDLGPARIIDCLLTACLAATGAPAAFLFRPAVGGGSEGGFVGRSPEGDWDGEVPPLIEDAIDRAFEDQIVVHVEGDEIGAEFGEADGVEAILAVPFPIVLERPDAGPPLLVDWEGRAVLGLQAPHPLEAAGRDAVLGLVAQATSLLAAAELRRREVLDPETGLLEERALEGHLADMLSAGRCCVVRIATGGPDLAATARNLSERIGPEGLIGRTGPAELTVLLSGPTENATRKAAEGWIAALDGGGRAGVAIATESADAREALVRSAEALAAADDEDPVVAWTKDAVGGAPIGLVTGRGADDAGRSAYLAEALALGREADESTVDLLARIKDLLGRASGAVETWAGLGRAAESLSPVNGFDEERLAEAFEAGPAGVLWKKRNRCRLTLTLPGNDGPVGAAQLDFEEAEPPSDRLYLLRRLAVPIGLAVENALLIAEVARLRTQVGEPAPVTAPRGRSKPRGRTALKYDYSEIIGDCAPMIEVFAMLDKVIDSNVPVLILGESGTGKELIARAIHFKGPRKNRSYVSENCAAVTETLLESELFGYVKGAFTGASQNKRGLFEVADGGTLFLDEVGDMSPGMQKKLLRALQEGEIRPVGGKSVKHVDTRVIAATNRDLQVMMKEGTFREDLFYRLNVVAVNLPPLRERSNDVKILIDFFLAKTCREMGVDKPVEDDAMRCLLAYRWPGNIRELENEVKRIVALSDDVIDTSVLSPAILEAGS